MALALVNHLVTRLLPPHPLPLCLCGSLCSSHSGLFSVPLSTPEVFPHLGLCWACLEPDLYLRGLFLTMTTQLCGAPFPGAGVPLMTFWVCISSRNHPS